MKRELEHLLPADIERRSFEIISAELEGRGIALLEETAPIVKRVIALEGQTVDIDYDAGTVAVDGQVLDEPYILEEMLWPSSSHMQETHFEVPEDSIFVMGDNRNGSSDSRDPSLGVVDVRCVIGQAVMVLFPFSDFGSL